MNSLLGVTSFDMVVEGVLIFVFSFAKRTNGLEETDFFLIFWRWIPNYCDGGPSMEVY